MDQEARKEETMNGKRGAAAASANRGASNRRPTCAYHAAAKVRSVPRIPSSWIPNASGSVGLSGVPEEGAQLPHTVVDYGGFGLVVARTVGRAALNQLLRQIVEEARRRTRLRPSTT